MLTQNYWQSRWEKGATGWDVGHITPPIQTFIDQLTDKNARILVPGAGAGHEVAYLWEKGFKNTFVSEWSPTAWAQFQQRCPDFPAEQWFQGDFFDLNLSVDIVIEQTFFCAIDPEKRPNYARKMSELLEKKPTSRLVGLLFNRIFEQKGPPFGGTMAEYRRYFAPFFDFEYFDICPNSIPPRQGSEIWLSLIPHL